MIIIAPVLGLIGFICLCWLLFVLAVHALPFFVGMTAGLAAYHSGLGLVAAFIVGAIAAAITFSAGQIAFARRRSPVIRAATALLFAVLAAIAGYMQHSVSRTSSYQLKLGEKRRQSWERLWLPQSQSCA